MIGGGDELFGNATLLPLRGASADSGFQALAEYDTAALGGNGDFKINRHDDVWSKLVLWTDADADGISDAGEIQSISESSLRSLRVIPRHRDSFDEAGNWLVLWAKARTKAAESQFVDSHVASDAERF